MERDLRRLKRQALVSDRTLEISGKKTLRTLTLTRTGKRLMKTTGRLPEEQAIYHGLVKPRALCTGVASRCASFSISS